MIQKVKKIIKSNKSLYALYLFVFKLFRKKDKRVASYEDLFSNVIGGSLLVTLKNIPGIYEIDARSHILRRVLITKEYEPDIVNLIMMNISEDKDVINIGANIGLYANLLASKINNQRKVLAVEPTPNAYNYLKRNIKKNGHEEKVIVYNGIASDLPGTYKINIIQGKEEYSSIGKIVHEAINDQAYITTEVEGETIDTLVEKYNLNPGIIVIDVEGAENQVLHGAVNTLKKYHPVIISELDDDLLITQNSDSRKVIDFLKSINYSVTDIKNEVPAFPFKDNIIAVFKR